MLASKHKYISWFPFFIIYWKRLKIIDAISTTYIRKSSLVKISEYGDFYVGFSLMRLIYLVIKKQLTIMLAVCICMSSGEKYLFRASLQFLIGLVFCHCFLLLLLLSREPGRIQLAGTIAMGQSLVKSAGIFSSWDGCCFHPSEICWVCFHGCC